MLVDAPRAERGATPKARQASLGSEALDLGSDQIVLDLGDGRILAFTWELRALLLGNAGPSLWFCVGTNRVFRNHGRSWAVIGRSLGGH